MAPTVAACAGTWTRRLRASGYAESHWLPTVPRPRADSFPRGGDLAAVDRPRPVLLYPRRL